MVLSFQQPSAFPNNNTKMDRILTKIYYIVFQVLKVLLIKIWHNLLFLDVFIRFYISSYHFHKFLELHSTLSEAKIFITSFPFLTDSLTLTPPTPPF